MKIAAITSYLYNARSGKNLLLVRVETDTGLHGWGECYTILRKEQIVENYVRLMTPFMLGRSAFNIRHLSRIVFDDFAMRRSNLDLSCAWSGIEIALWDIVGKAAGLPLHQILGGVNRGAIRVYANGWADGIKDLETILQNARKMVDRGFTALKWDPIPGPWRTFISKHDEDLAVENVRAVREVVGPSVDLLIDAHRRLAPNQAIALARRLEQFDIMQFEDPNLADNIELVAETRRAIRQPVVTGETLFTKEHFARVFATGAADIINPDICAVGGILPMLEFAAMAEPYGVAISPHNNNSTVVGLAATLQVSAVVPNFLITEYFVNLEAPSLEFGIRSPVVEDGYIELPTSPGLGVDVNVQALEARPYEAFARTNFRHPEEEFPRRGLV